jgi:hypothetical protein
MKEKIDSFFQQKRKTKVITSLFALFLAIIIAGTVVLPSQVLKAQNMTIKMDNATSAGNVTLNTPAANDQVSNNVIANLAAPGYGNKYDVVTAGQTVPVNYNIIQGALVGILGDPIRHSLNVALNPGPQGGALEIQVPRYLVDSKTPTNTDKPYVVLIDGQRISGESSGICVNVPVVAEKACDNIFNTFKQTQSSSTDRVLTILFGPESRFIEIRGNAGIA